MQKLKSNNEANNNLERNLSRNDVEHLKINKNLENN